MTTAAGIPLRYQLYWAQNAGGAYVRTVPVASQISITPGAASYNDGFVPLNMTPEAGGGIPPFGQDMNGVLRTLTQWTQWMQMGGPIPYDATFQTQIGGYPAGAIVSSAVTVGLLFISTVDNNVTDPDASGAGWTRWQTALVPATGGLLQFTNSTTLTLAPTAGGFLWINGLNYPIPASLTVGNGGLSASTLYYVYAKVTAGAAAIDTLSTTGYTVGTNGIPVKSGDATRTLVGAAVTNGSSQFVSQDGSLLVRTYFNRFLQRSRSQFSTDRTTTSGTFVELNTEIRNTVLVWAGEQVEFHTTGSFSCAANQAAATQIAFDGTTGEQESVALANNSGTNRGACAINGVKTGLSEGSHYATLLGARDVGTATWNGSNTSSTAQCTITLTVGR